MKKRVKEVLNRLTNEQKAKLLYGRKMWFVAGSEADKDLPDIMVCDGPSGLRKQTGEADIVGLNESVPAIAYPVGACFGCSWDVELAGRLGRALGEDCLKENVSVLLGPAINHKRDPLCGRDFEYISEDPILTGNLAAAYVNGVQSCGVGTSVKHYACNSQEMARTFNNSIVDERTLRELYLKQFEIVIKQSQPYTVMTAYNKLNGVHCSQNEELMTQLARKEWGYEGLFVTDWGAMRDQAESYVAGLDLEMPGTNGSDQDILEALESGKLTQKLLDEHAARVIELILNTTGNNKDFKYDLQKNLDIAREVAEKSAVLLKNEGEVLPLTGNESLAVIGSFAKQPRYQGGGSSKINPVVLDAPFDALIAAGVEFDYSEGYEPQAMLADEERIALAVETAKGKDKVILFVGLPDGAESEGYDRTTLDMPQSHTKLIEAVCAVNSNVIVVLMCGSPVTMPWADGVKAVLYMNLSGCKCGEACANLLLGKVNPSGKLSETFPVSYDDVPSFNTFGRCDDYTEYREGIFSGYRWYDTAKRKVLFPFGHGLSYTRFGYKNLVLSGNELKDGERLNVEFDVTNEGERDGAEVIQLYISHKNPTVFKAEKELKSFSKVFLAAGETKHVSLTLEFDDLAYFHTGIGGWYVDSGVYEIKVGASSADIRLSKAFQVENSNKVAAQDFKAVSPIYYNLPASGTLDVPQEQFIAVSKTPIPKERDKSHITLYSPIKDLQYSKAGAKIYEQMMRMAGSNPDPAIAQMQQTVAREMPLIGICLNTPVTRKQIMGLVAMVNGENNDGNK